MIGITKSLALKALWLLGYIWLHSFAKSIIFDINNPHILPDISIYEGTFAYGGVYKMFHLVTPIICAITDAEHFIDAPKHRFNGPMLSFVQVYTRDDLRIVSISYHDPDNSEVFATKHFQKMFEQYSKISVRDKHEFIGSPVSLAITLHSDQNHPFIVKTLMEWNGTTFTHYKTSRNRRSLRTRLLEWLRYLDHNFYLSPIFNIDGNNSGSSDISPSLISRAREVLTNVQRTELTLIIKNSEILCEIEVEIPPTLNGIFKPKRIIKKPYYFNRVKKSRRSYDYDRNVVDIAQIHVIKIEMIVLANIKRGDWLYTQFAIAYIPRRNYERVKVIDSVIKADIYEEGDDEFISHVEVFYNTVNGAQYVVINVNNIPEGDPQEVETLFKARKIFMVNKLGSGATYIDLNCYDLEPYIDTLYNIRTEAANDAPQNIR